MSDVNSDAGLRDVGGHDSFPHPVGRLVDHRALLGDAEGVQGQQHAGVVDLGVLAGRLHHPGDLRDAAAENERGTTCPSSAARTRTARGGGMTLKITALVTCVRTLATLRSGPGPAGCRWPAASSRH